MCPIQVTLLSYINPELLKPGTLTSYSSVLVSVDIIFNSG